MMQDGQTINREDVDKEKHQMAEREQFFFYFLQRFHWIFSTKLFNQHNQKQRTEEKQKNPFFIKICFPEKKRARGVTCAME